MHGDWPLVIPDEAEGLYEQVSAPLEVCPFLDACGCELECERCEAPGGCAP